MEIVSVERLDHLGIVAGVIKELGIVELIDARIDTDSREEITTGEAIAGMILNGLGFFSRPLSLTPQFFENKLIAALFRDGVKAEHFNRFKLGRSLDDVYEYGCDLLFSEIALSVCQQEGIDLRFNSGDTTTFSVHGEYVPDSDEQTVELRDGYSKDHRPDLKQAVLELVVSQDGGIPFISKSWSGNESDVEIFKERTKALIDVFKSSEGPRYLICDSKLYTKGNAKNLALLLFITRIPKSIKLEREIVQKALVARQWTTKNDKLKFQTFDVVHYEMTQRWIVVYSTAAHERAKKSVKKRQQQELERVEKKLFHLQAKRFGCDSDAEMALIEISKTLRFHQITRTELKKHIKYEGKGRPTKDRPIKEIKWQITAEVAVEPEKVETEIGHQSCFVLGTNIPNNTEREHPTAMGAEIIETETSINNEAETQSQPNKSPGKDIINDNKDQEHPATMDAVVVETKIQPTTEINTDDETDSHPQPNELNDTEVIDAYKGQEKVENGFRFLKDPLFFVSSLFLKKPSRIQGLLMVMTLALLIYSVAQRRLRAALVEQKEMLPNQINQPTTTPILRWVFQLMEGINRVVIAIENQIQIIIEGMTEIREKIIRLFGGYVCKIYKLEPT